MKRIPVLYIIAVFLAILSVGFGILYKVWGGGTCLPIERAVDSVSDLEIDSASDMAIDSDSCRLQDNLGLPLSAFSFILAVLLFLIQTAILIVRIVLKLLPQKTSQKTSK